MLKVIVILFVLVSSISVGQEREIMYRIENELMDECGYVNQNGDTLIPFGECVICFTDSLNYAIVVKWERTDYAFPIIDSKGNELYGAFIFDNGPDYVEDGTFRIVKDDKIGYMTVEGEIIISPTYEGAWPFENGRALVSYKADIESDGEHSWWVGGDWFYIDKNGNRHKNQKE